MILTVVMFSIAGLISLGIAVVAVRKRPTVWIPPAGDPVSDRIRPHPGPVDWDTLYEWVPVPGQPGRYELWEKRKRG